MGSWPGFAMFGVDGTSILDGVCDMLYTKVWRYLGIHVIDVSPTNLSFSSPSARGSSHMKLENVQELQAVGRTSAIFGWSFVPSHLQPPVVY